MKPRIALLAFAFALAAAPTGLTAAEPGAWDLSMVEVRASTQRHDPHFPWRRDRPSDRVGYGVVIGRGRIVTTEELVRNQTLVQIRRPKTGQKIPARVVCADYQANTALIEFTDESALAGLKPVTFAPRIARGATVRIVELDDSDQAQTGEGHITEISVAGLPSAPTPALTFKVLTDLKVSGNGAPVFIDGQLAGLAMRFDRDNQTSLVLPSTVLSRFVADVDTPPYAGVAAAGLHWTALVDPVKRAFLGLKDPQGILVVRTVPGTGAATVLQPEDVIVEWDGLAIDDQGYYTDPEYGRLLLPYAINGRHQPGDVVPVTVIRNRQRLTVQLKLDTHRDENALIPENIVGDPPAYVVDGGFVIRELTGDYLRAYGPKWMIAANPRLVDLYLSRAQMPEKPDDRVVILSSVLPDPLNVGYTHLRDEIVTHVNGTPVRNLKDAVAALDREGGIHRLTLRAIGTDIVLDPRGISDANQRTAAEYRIPELRSRAP